MVVFPDKPIPVVVEGDKDGYVLYIETSGAHFNDIWTVVLCKGGMVRHYTTKQVRVRRNDTMEIEKESPT